MSSKLPVPSSARRQRSGPKTRAEIVAAAERHFAERGFAATRLDDIAADVGVRRAAIFYYFSDKHELYAAVLTEVFSSALAALMTHGTAAERIEASLVGWIDYVAQRPSVARLILREAASARPDEVSPFTQAGKGPVESFRAMIDEAVSAGEMKPLIDPNRFISLMGATTVFHFAAMPLLTPDGPFDPRSHDELEKYKREILLVARTMLGIRSRPAGG